MYPTNNSAGSIGYNIVLVGTTYLQFQPIITQTYQLDLVTATGATPTGAAGTAFGNIVVTNGTGANQATNFASDTRTLAATASETLDFNGGLVDAFGNVLTFTRLIFLMVKAHPSNIADLRITVPRVAPIASLTFTAAGTHIGVYPTTPFAVLPKRTMRRSPASAACRTVVQWTCSPASEIAGPLRCSWLIRRRDGQDTLGPELHPIPRSVSVVPVGDRRFARFRALLFRVVVSHRHPGALSHARAEHDHQCKSFVHVCPLFEVYLDRPRRLTGFAGISPARQ
jgi:hypothetical protein